MRVMKIPRFPRKILPSELGDDVMRTRLIKRR